MDSTLSDISSLKNIGKLKFYEKLFSRTMLLSALLIIVIMIAVFLTLVVSSMPSIKALGFKFLGSSRSQSIYWSEDYWISFGRHINCFNPF